MNAVLDTIVTGLRQSLPGQEARVPIPQLQTSPHYNVPCLSLVDYLSRPDKNGIIAEFKRASPSRGAYRLDADLPETTRGYMQAGEEKCDESSDARTAVRGIENGRSRSEHSSHDHQRKR